MTIARISSEELARLGDRLSEDPAVDKLYRLTKAHVEQEGGQTLEIWQLHMGNLWGRPYIMTADEVAKRLNLPLSEVNRVILATDEVVRKQWFATDEFKTSRFAKK